MDFFQVVSSKCSYLFMKTRACLENNNLQSLNSRRDLESSDEIVHDRIRGTRIKWELHERTINLQKCWNEDEKWEDAASTSFFYTFARNNWKLTDRTASPIVSRETRRTAEFYFYHVSGDESRDKNAGTTGDGGRLISGFSLLSYSCASTFCDN